MAEMEKKQWMRQTLFSPDGPRDYGKEPRHQWPLQKDGTIILEWLSNVRATEKEEEREALPSILARRGREPDLIWFKPTC